jgi:catechol 2,3-dioxygenase-like lactoylglutathione lyase family enzyme
VDLNCVTIDCHDPDRVVQFWNEALGWGGVAVTEDGGGAVCGPAAGGLYLEFRRVPDDKVVKNHLHIGSGVADLVDLDAEIDRLTALGATIAWEEEFPPEVAARYRILILRDPEGNEFCLGAGDDG